jgi:hypothetical protein
MTGLTRLFPADPPGFLARAPYGYRDAAQIRADLAPAGFTDIAIEAVTLPCGGASPADPAIGYCQGKPAPPRDRSAATRRVAAATDAIASALSERFGAGGIESTMQALSGPPAASGSRVPAETKLGAGPPGAPAVEVLTTKATSVLALKVPGVTST